MPKSDLSEVTKSLNSYSLNDTHAMGKIFVLLRLEATKKQPPISPLTPLKGN
jgi:hypothetical protein